MRDGPSQIVGVAADVSDGVVDFRQVNRISSIVRLALTLSMMSA
jgi:hypothetical protein